ncbi:MAG: 3-deoxy-manno-octulosonate cytidylyltransferase [Salibacteraceae bacterium]
MKIAGIIPARYASTRFPGKPLVDIAGKTMIQRVYERASKCTALCRVVVATDDQRVYDHVKDFGGEVLMTSPDHLTGTDRCVEAAQMLDEDFDAIINIQGDEPVINTCQLDLLAFCFNDDQCEIATLCVKIKDPDILWDTSKIKVVLDHNHRAMYFSRHPIPFQQRPYEQWMKHHTYYKHIGIYGFRADVLPQLGRLPEGMLEKAESLEQLRWMENGYKIQVKITEFDSISVDVPSDLERVFHLLDDQ